MTIHQRTIWISEADIGNNADYLQKLLNHPSDGYPCMVINNLELGQTKIGMTYPLTSDERVQQVIDKAQKELISAESGNDDSFPHQPKQGNKNAEDSAWLFFIRQ